MKLVIIFKFLEDFSLHAHFNIELPFSIDIQVPKVPIARNGSMQLKIVATKKEGWDEQINIQLPFRPPGVGAWDLYCAGNEMALYAEWARAIVGLPPDGADRLRDWQRRLSPSGDGVALPPRTPTVFLAR